MPLPKNGQISLHSHSLPGETTSTKPKQAMIVRMTEETLDALQNLDLEERMEFAFGDNPGIWIRDVFFPMRAQSENSTAELFMRTTTAAKPMGPLKLTANVVGRFAVENKDLSDKLSKQIHESTAAARSKRLERRTQFIDTPPAVTSIKVSSRTSRPSQIMNRSPLPSRPPSSQLHQSISASTSSPAEGTSPLRTRLVHLLALGPQTLKQILDIAGGPDDASARSQIASVLTEIAEQEALPKKNQGSSSQNSRTWMLKPQLWLEVRPYQFTNYTEQERLSVCRTARTRYHSLKVPENDPAWERVTYRPTGAAASVAHATSSKSSEMKRGIFPNNPLGQKGKPKVRPSEVKLKPETVPARPNEANTSREHPLKISTSHSSASMEKEEGEISATPPSRGARRLPGSRVTAGIARAHSPPTHSMSPTPNLIQSPKKRPGPVDARGSRNELPAPSGSARPAPPLPPPPRVEKKAQTNPPTAVKKEKITPSPNVKSDPKDSQKDVAGTLASVRQRHEDEDGGSADGKATAGLKRKQVGHRADLDDNGPSRKKGVQMKQPSRREQSPPRNPVKRERSPLPPVKSSQPVALKNQPLPRGSPDSVKLDKRRKHLSDNSSKSHRRRSPIYTSSEDEKHGKLSMKTPPEHMADRGPATARLSSVRPRPSALATDHTSLRARYSTVYLDYIAVFHKVVAQKNKIERRLKAGSGSSASEDDLDMMSTDELERLSAEHKRLQDELESIKDAWGR